MLKVPPSGPGCLSKPYHRVVSFSDYKRVDRSFSKSGMGQESWSRAISRLLYARIDKLSVCGPTDSGSGNSKL